MRYSALGSWTVIIGLVSAMGAGHASSYRLAGARAGGGGLTAATAGSYSLAAAASQAAAGRLAGGAYRLNVGLLRPGVRDVSTAPPTPPVPSALAFSPARPNPARGMVALFFELPDPTPVRLEVFGLDGRRVAMLAERTFQAGRHQVFWDGAREDGGRAAPGVYFVSLGAGARRLTQRLVLVAP